MPEGNRFEKVFGAGWRGAYRRARNDDAPPAEVADKLVTTLARTLREQGGIPGFGEMQGVIENAVWRSALQASGAGEEAVILIESFNALDRIVRHEEGHRHTKVAADVAKSLLVQQDALANSNRFWPAPHFAKTTCAALVEHYFFANARENMVAEGKFRDHEQARHWQRTVEEAMRPATRQVAERLEKKP
ncbi:MAG: hypothetical protein O3A47_07155, partial [Chloroflexi bacterium]|nr:hypothetical protein [Chloroflexota bacterium]